MYGSYGGGYANSASGFATNLAYATAGGSDTAYFYDSPGKDTFYAYGDYNNSGKTAAGMYGSYGSGYANAASGFATNLAYATAGGSDTAYFYDSPGNDTFYAYADYNNSGKNVPQACTGGYPVLRVPAAAMPTRPAVSAPTSATRLTAAATRLIFTMLPGTDTYYAYAPGNVDGGGKSSAGMYGSYGGGYANSARGFSTNIGYATSGSSDTAYLSGSTGNNALYADLAIAELYGSGFAETASGFEVVNAIAVQGAVNSKEQGPINYQLNYLGTWVEG